MSSASRWRALAALVAVVGATALAFTKPVRPGLDVASRPSELLRRHVDALGVAEPTPQRSDG